MNHVTEGVWQLSGFPPDLFNVYLVEDVLIDAATRWARSRILRQLRGRRLSLVALTHCHPDHQGVARLLCEKFRVPLACHEADVPVMEGRAAMEPNNWLLRLGVRIWAGPPYPVGRVLREGDQVAGFRVIHAPGHTPGHIILFRDADRVAIVGDLLCNIHFLTGKVGLRQPPRYFSVDAEQNRRSIRLLHELRPSLICFGHGPPLRHPELLEKYLVRMQ
jgi:glyoxylase-like metal-dependent hydrolase (beta-lactamase superfamily II)